MQCIITLQPYTPANPGPPPDTRTQAKTSSLLTALPFLYTSRGAQWVLPWALLSLHLTVSLELISHQHVKSFLRFYTLT